MEDDVYSIRDFAKVFGEIESQDTSENQLNDSQKIKTK